MKTAGIIAEYNPFHLGHRYHIEETRRRTGADYIVAVMSPDFVQRGAPAILDKYTRARMALENGADLVIELPVISALSSAEGFAAGGVNLLDRLGVVDVLSFGTEAPPGEAPLLVTAAEFLRNEPEPFSARLRSFLRKGMSYPQAREAAFAVCLQKDHCSPQAGNQIPGNQSVPSSTQSGCSPQAGNQTPASDTAAKKAVSEDDMAQICRLLENPNNILALEYTKALLAARSSMEICMIQRQGSGHSDSTLAPAFSSASAIRAELLRSRSQATGITEAANSLQFDTYPNSAAFAVEHSTGEHCGASDAPASAAFAVEHSAGDPCGATDALAGTAIAAEHSAEDPCGGTAALADALCAGNLPSSVLTAIGQADPRALLCEDDFSDLLFFSIEEKRDTLGFYGNGNADLAARTGQLFEQFESWTRFAALLKTKNQTYTAISRYLTHLLLGITEKDRETAAAFGFAPYARILGFRTGAAPLITEMKEHSCIPLLFRPARDRQLLDEAQTHLFELDQHAAAIYSRILYTRTGKRRPHELRQPLILLP